MNREDLIKKLELARVGNGTQTYNDVVVTLTKEETLELLKYIENLEKEYQKLKEIFKKRAELCSEFAEYNSQYEKALDFLMDKFKLELKGNRLYFLYNNQYFELDKKEYNLLKEVLGDD